MKDIYGIFMRGGDGHKFLSSLIAHSLLNWKFIPEFPNGNSHMYWNNYISKYIRAKISKTPHQEIFLKYEPINNTTPFICLLNSGASDKVKSIYKNYQLISITVTKEDYVMLEANHYLKRWKFEVLNENNPFFNFYTKSKFNDQKFPSLLGKKSFSELPQDFVLEIFKDYIQHLLFVNNYLENYNKNEYIGVPFQTIMFDEKNLINLLEQITETKATESVIKTIQKYQTVQTQLQTTFPEFFNIK